jgi:segregation and condensation protein B
VDSSYALGVLSEKSLIEAVGRLDVPGKPNLYGTTPDFLRVFGLSSLEELPSMSDEPQQTTLQLEGI